MAVVVTREQHISHSQRQSKWTSCASLWGKRTGQAEETGSQTDFDGALTVLTASGLCCTLPALMQTSDKKLLHGSKETDSA